MLVLAQYMIDPNRSVALDADQRQNGQGTWLRSEYSQAFGQRWRATAGFTWIHGDATDFLGQFHRNSFVAARAPLQLLKACPQFDYKLCNAS